MSDLEVTPDPRGRPDLRCYRCGGTVRATGFTGGGDAAEYSFVCPDCGDFSVIVRDSLHWTVKGADVPYIPVPPPDAGTGREGPAPPSFPDERSALTAEVGLLVKLAQGCGTTLDGDSFAGLEERLTGLLERSSSLGIDELRGMTAMFAKVSMSRFDPGSEEYRRFSETFEENRPFMNVREMIQVVILSHALGTVRGSAEPELEALLRDIYSKADRWDGTFDGESFDNAMMAAIALRGFDGSDRSTALFEKCLRSVKEGGGDDRDELTAQIWKELCASTYDDDGLERMMDDVRPLRDAFPAEFAVCAVHYGRELSNVQSLHAAIVSDMDWILGNAVPSLYGSEETDLIEMNARYIRFIVTGDRKDLGRAMEIALEDLSLNWGYLSRESAWVMADYLENRNPSRRFEDRIYNGLGAAGMDIDDLYSIAGFRSPLP